MLKSNLHTHTVFSDGKNTAEEIVEEAIKRSFKAIGFSDHSYTPAQGDCAMIPGKEYEQYDEILRLKYKYVDLINIYSGIELDLFSSVPAIDYDYIIGSVHEIKRNGISEPVDNGAVNEKKLIDLWFNGDIISFAREYFGFCIENAKNKNFDIVGHFDLITKYSLFDETNREYMSVATEAIREVLKYKNTFEFNTGAIARGYRKVPYPDIYLLPEIKKAGGRLIVTSDCHYREKLTMGFEIAEEILINNGFRMNENGQLNSKVNGIEIWE